MTTRRVIRADVSPIGVRERGEEGSDNGGRCARCRRTKEAWQVYCGAACCAMAEAGHAYPYLESEKAEVALVHAAPAVAVQDETDPWHPLTEDPDR